MPPLRVLEGAVEALEIVDAPAVDLSIGASPTFTLGELRGRGGYGVGREAAVSLGKAEDSPDGAAVVVSPMLDDGAAGTEASPAGVAVAATPAGPPGDACSEPTLVEGAAAAGFAPWGWTGKQAVAVATARPAVMRSWVARAGFTVVSFDAGTLPADTRSLTSRSLSDKTPALMRGPRGAAAPPAATAGRSNCRH